MRTQRHQPAATIGDVIGIIVLFAIVFGVAMFGQAMADALWAMF